MNPRCLHILLSLVLLVGCSTEDAPKSKTAADSIRSETVRGPVTLIVEVTPGVIHLSDEPTLTLTIKAKPGVEVTKPPFGESVGEFLIRDYHEPLPLVDAKAEITRQIYTLEPTRAGTLTIAPIAVMFQDNRADGDGQKHIVESEALQVEVNTVVGEDVPSLADLKPSVGPIELPSSGPPMSAWIATGVAAGVIAIVIWLILRQVRLASQEPPLTPRQLARMELDRIISRRLAETDVKEFYVEITGVVRRYIERSTGVRAPEQTTEEFLREILTNSVFSDDVQRRLQQFLESADLVKFAGYRPAQEDMESSVERARQFTQWDSSPSVETAE